MRVQQLYLEDRFRFGLGVVIDAGEMVVVLIAPSASFLLYRRNRPCDNEREDEDEEDEDKHQGH